MKKKLIIIIKDKRIIINDSKLPCSSLYLMIMVVWYELVSVSHLDG